MDVDAVSADALQWPATERLQGLLLALDPEPHLGLGEFKPAAAGQIRPADNAHGHPSLDAKHPSPMQQVWGWAIPLSPLQGWAMLPSPVRPGQGQAAPLHVAALGPPAGSGLWADWALLQKG